MKSKLRTLALSATLFCSQTVTAFATGDTGNAVSDIMNDERFEGAMSSISWLSNIVDHYMTMAITLVAFFIISMALFRNVCAAAYCSNNKFWNQVAEAHEAADGASLMSIAQGIKGLPNKTWGGTGGIKGTLLCLIPNIKALTDFDDVDMEPKHYWMKAIPQMLACIVIGVFVYNGYYRDTASVVGEMGSEVVSRALASVNPADFIDKITLTTGTPDNIYANDGTVHGKMNYTISMELYKAFRAKWGISDENQKTILMRNCEVMADELTRNITAFTVSTVNTNKVMNLSGLSVTLVGATNNGSDLVSIGASGWSGSTGCNGAENVAFHTEDDGETYNFNVWHVGPTVNDEVTNPKYRDLCSYAKLSGTLTRVDGNQSAQSSSIVSNNAVLTGGSKTIAVDKTISLSGAGQGFIKANAGDGRQVPASFLSSNLSAIQPEIRAAIETYLTNSDSSATYIITEGPTIIDTTGPLYSNKNDIYLAAYNAAAGNCSLNIMYTVSYTYTSTNKDGVAKEGQSATIRVSVPIVITDL